MNNLDLNRWLSLFPRNTETKARQTFLKLDRLYTEKHRHYHTPAHIADCLKHLDSAREQANDPTSIEIAIWFHDAIYDTRRDDNEKQSAELAKKELSALCFSSERIPQINNFIMATQHTSSHPRNYDEAMLLDIDLAILGAPESEFSLYEENIRKEYIWVEESYYRRLFRNICG